MAERKTGSPVIVALDYSDPRMVEEFTDRASPDLCRIKLGKEAFTCGGPGLVKGVVEKGFDVFLDLKFHDIPNTVERACRAAAGLGIWMLNVHALGGTQMMRAARKGVGEAHGRRPLLVAVTILTSMDAADLREVGLDGTPEENVTRLARLAQRAGLDGIVCSPRETRALRSEFGKDFRLVTPGIRPAGMDAADQRRIATPGDAVRNGSDFLVIGRAVTEADDPISILLTINSEIAALNS